MKIEPVLNDINEAKLLRAVEQKILEYKKSLVRWQIKLMHLVLKEKIMWSIWGRQMYGFRIMHPIGRNYLNR